MWIVIWILFGIGAALAAASKGRNAVGWFFLGLLLGPFAILFALLTKRLQGTETMKTNPRVTTSPGLPSSLSDEQKACPSCAESIKLEAKKCRFCGEKLDEAKVEQDIQTRRDYLTRLSQGEKQCRRCGSWEVYRAVIEDGSQGWWCPHCQMSQEKIEKFFQDLKN